MAQPNSFDTLAEYCLQQLGAPVIDIHVAEEQVQNRIEDAFDFFQEFHGDATELTFQKYVVKGNQIATPAATSFTVGETVTGQVSNATAKVLATSAGILTVDTPVGTFTLTETIIGNQSATNSTVTTYTQGDIDKGFIAVPAGVTAIRNVYPLTNAGGTNSNSQFSAAYQMKLDDMYALLHGDVAGNGNGWANLAQYEAVKQYLNTMDFVLTGEKIYQYNAKTRRLVIDMDWKNSVKPGDTILAEAYVIVDPAAYASIWNDRMLKKLATAYIKKQWGNNLKLHSSVILLGGVTVNGQAIYDEAVTEIDAIEEQIRDTYELPVGFLIG